MAPRSAEEERGEIESRNNGKRSRQVPKSAEKERSQSARNREVPKSEKLAIDDLERGSSAGCIAHSEHRTKL